MSRPRVLHCIYDDPGNPWLGGGGAHRVFEIYRRLTSELDVTVATGAYPGARFPASSDTPAADREGVRYRLLGRPRPYALSRWTYAREATSLLRDADYDVAFFDFSVYTPIRIPRQRPVTHVVHMPIGPTARRRWGRLAGAVVAARERRMLRRAERVQTTSEWMRAALRPLVAPGADIRVVRSGVDGSFFEVERAEQDHVLFYGRFDLFQKGLDVLLESASGWLRERPDVRLVLAGRGRDREEVVRRAAAADLGDRIVVIEEPSRAEVQRLMSGALCLVHPSRFEGLPVVPAEAMAAGVPVVATDVGAVAEVLGDPPGGLLTEPDSAPALAAAIRRVLDDTDLRSTLSTRARAAARRFIWDDVARDHLAHVRSLVGL